MTDPTPDLDMPEREIVFAGRTIWVRFPDPSRLLIWQRTLAKLQSLDADRMNFEQVMALMERVRSLVDSILVNRTDIEWIDDEMLAGNLTVLSIAPLVTQAVEAFSTDTNRETRRAAKKTAPAKKAARKAVTR